MIYLVYEYSGTFPLEHQLYWTNEFNTVDDAIQCARTAYETREARYPDVDAMAYNVIVRELEDELCERPEFVKWRGVEYQEDNAIKACRQIEDKYPE